MIHIHRGFIYWIVFIVYYVVCISDVNARIVVVLYDGDTDITKQEAYQIAAVEALLGETEEYFSQKLPVVRRDAIRQYFGILSQSLTSNITEVESIELEDGKVKGIFNVPVRQKVLYNLLRELGTSYTLNSLQPYTLQLVIPDSSFFPNKLVLLEKISGVVQQNTLGEQHIGPTLQLTFEDGNWIGVLFSESSESIQASNNSLDNVWREIWGKFFSRRQEAASINLQECILEVSGWKHAAGVEELERTLEHWEASVNNVLLQGVSINKGAVTAQWVVNIVDIATFEQQVMKYALARNLQYTIKPIHKDSQE